MLSATVARRRLSDDMSRWMIKSARNEFFIGFSSPTSSLSEKVIDETALSREQQRQQHCSK